MRVSKQQYNKAISTIRKFLDEANQDWRNYKDVYARIYDDTVDNNEAVADYAQKAYNELEDTMKKIRDAEKRLDDAIEELAALLNTY